MKYILLGLCLLMPPLPSLAQLIKKAEMPLNDSLKTGAAVYNVKQKFSFSEGKADMHFGPYQAHVQFDLISVKRKSGGFGSHGGSFGGSITTTYSKIRDPLHFSFQLADSSRRFNSYTDCTNNIEKLTDTQANFGWIRANLSLTPNVSDVFAGAMLIRNDTINADPTAAPNWSFIFYTAPKGITNDSAQAFVGLISNDDESVQINMTGVIGYTIRAPAWTGMNNALTGYEFRYHNQLIGAVDMTPQGITKGRVWLKNDLPDRFKFLVSNVVEALMAENELGN